MEATLTGYFAALAAADPGRALAVLERAQEAGAPRADLVRHVIGPAQEAIGDRWHEGSWGVADEHAATSIAEHILAVFAPPESRPDATVTAWLACAEGEWHTFPPRLAASLASEPRLRVVTLGGSITGEQLRRYLATSPPDALALSATLPVNLLGAARSIRAARAEGVPVTVGGAAWGNGQHRARRLGAEMFLDDPAELATVVAGLPSPRTFEELPAVPNEVDLLERPPEELLRLAFLHHCRASAWMKGMDSRQEQRTMEDLGWMARHAAAAVLCDDATVVRDLFVWLVALLTPRGVPGGVVLDSARYLADAVDPVAPQAAAVLRSEASSVGLAPTEPEEVDDQHG